MLYEYNKYFINAHKYIKVTILHECQCCIVYKLLKNINVLYLITHADNLCLMV